MKQQWNDVARCLLAGLMAVCLATASFAQEEPILTTQLALVTTPTLGGQGTVVWCGVADRPIPEAELTLAVASGEGTGKQVSKMAPQKLSLTEGKAADAELKFATPAPGRYRITARVDWQDGEGAKSKADALTVLVDKNGKVSLAPEVVTLSMNNGQATTNVRGVWLNNTCAGSPYQYRAAETATALNSALWQAYSTNPVFKITSAGDGIKTVFFQVRDAAGASSEAAMDAIRMSTMKVVYPTDAGITWFQGETRTLKWYGCGGATVKLDLLKAGTLVAAINAAAPNTGALNWTMPATIPPGNDYKVRVSSLMAVPPGYAGPVDLSDYPFTVARRPLVTYPSVSGITWNHGNAYPIMWQDFPGNTVQIDLYKGSTLALNIAKAATNNGNFRWTVPNSMAAGNDYKIRIMSVSGSASFTDSSDNAFRISTAPAVVYPSASGIVWTWEQPYTIKWSGFPGTTVKIELFKGGVFKQTIAAAAANSGSMNWTCPRGLTPGGDYKVKISTTYLTMSMSDFSDSQFAVVGDAKVVYPTAAGITWDISRVYTIKWEGFPGTTVKIELLKGTVVAQTVAAAAANTGSLNWTVPTTTVPGNDYRIRVTATVAPTGAVPKQDISDNPFTIRANVRVIDPSDRGTTWYQASPYVIKWEGCPGTTVRIDLVKGATLVLNIAAAATNTGNYRWTVPTSVALGIDYRVKITSTSSGVTYSDVSDNPFTIARRPTVLYPSNSGVLWLVGRTYRVTWMGYTAGSVTIDLYKAGVFHRALVGGTPNDGGQDVVVPAGITLGNDFQIRVAGVGVAEADMSDTPFVIADPKVTNPNTPNAVWVRGMAAPIRWTGYVGSQVKIELLKGGALYQTITGGTANVGGFNWTVPATIPVGSDYRVRVTLTTASSMTDTCDANFSIIVP